MLTSSIKFDCRSRVSHENQRWIGFAERENMMIDSVKMLCRLILQATIGKFDTYRVRQTIAMKAVKVKVPRKHFKNVEDEMGGLAISGTKSKV